MRIFDRRKVATLALVLVAATFTGARAFGQSQKAFQKSLTITVPGGADSNNPRTKTASAAFTVPAGKRLIIEHVSARGDFPQRFIPPTNYTLAYAVFTLSTTVGGVTSAHAVEKDFEGLINGLCNVTSGEEISRTRTTSSRPMRAYADPNTTVRFTVARLIDAAADSYVNCSSRVEVSISGYLVDASSTTL